MRHRLGIVISCVVLLLALVMAANSWADFVVEEVFPGIHRVSADLGSFETQSSYDIRMFNDSGGALSPGAVLVLDTGPCGPGVGCVKMAPAGEMEKVIGVATGLSFNDSPVSVAVAGIALVDITGSVSAGDLLKVSSTVAGEAEAAASGEKGVFAIALEDKTNQVAYAIFSKQELY